MDPYQAQIRECFARVAYSHKAHEKTADLLLWRLSALKFLQILISAIVTGTLIAATFDKAKVAVILSAILSTALLALNTYMKNYDLGGIAQKHADTAVKLWEIREAYLSLLTDMKIGALDRQTLTARRDDLQKHLAACYKSAPRTIPKGYKLAQRALQLDEDLTFSDAEIDNFLPPPLRITTPKE